MADCLIMSDRMRALHRISGRLRGPGIHPVAVVLVVASIVDALSGNPVDAVFLAGVGLVVLWEPTVTGDTDLASRAESRRPGPGVLALLAAYGVAVGRFAVASWPLTVAVLLPAVAAFALYAEPTRPSPAPVPTWGLAAWMVVLLTLGLWELVNLLLQPSLTVGSYDHPTLSVLAEPYLAQPAWRTAGFVTWLAAGWYVVRR